jgi:outer membrane receptor protein involved in Fe transport
VQARASSEQFDDDLNQFRLEPYAQVDLYASRRVSERVEVYAALENVFNSRYSIGRTPVRTVNSPVNGRVGIRFGF